MNRTNAILLCLASVAVGVNVSCSQEGPGAGSPNAGSTSATTSTSSGAGGAATSATTGNTTSTSSTSSTSSGAGGDPTTSGSGGTTGAGGDPTTTTSGGGSGGSATTGGGGGAGTGGAGGSTGGAGTGGAGGSTGGAGGGGMVTPAMIVPTLDGYFWEGTCAGASTEMSRDCKILNDMGQCPATSATTPFNMRGAFRRFVHKVGGTMGTKYMINFHVRGVAGGKYYTGGTLRSATGYSESGPNDGWYEGGTPTDSKWNTYEMYVDPPVPGAKNTYYLNAFPTASGFDGRHETFHMKYSASFPVLGGGTITMVIHDSNCLGQQNCGGNTDPTCTQPRTIDVSGMSPPAMFMQPPVNNVAGVDYHPQWLYFDVTSVVQQ